MENGKPTLVRIFRGKEISGRVYKADALHLLRSLPNESMSVVFLDPPFNLGKIYGRRRKKADSLPPVDYLCWLNSILDEAVRVLQSGGALYVYHLPEWAMKIGAYLTDSLDFRHWIAIAMKNGFVRGQRLYPAHYALLYFTKGMPKRFYRPKLQPVRCRHCENVVKDYGGYWPVVKKKGLNLSDFWEDISPVRHAGKKARSANELPPKLVSRIVSISGRKGSTFLDPFCGSGAAVLAAAERGMKFVAGDLSAPYAKLTAERIEQLK